ncbi:hypothetical protein [Rubrivirga litoralis]|uniref:Outer membrane protein beta-barrel domain-containing protein n=1 Tax=Rubrivirga litoralis TaxID=3075598 RepID=A0ABU3BPB6_9BACT|nr:hypothetical protein [Rubrivirga sp. F394]MDT0631139.1 hypothetical protein [Rubrivirga sp. F394]
MRLASRLLPALALAACLAAPRAEAQIIPSIDVGVAGGVNFASLGDAAGLDFDGSTGYHIGAFADVSVLLFQARTGVYYLRAGDVQGEGEDGSISFVTVPVDFKLQTPTPILKGYVLVGPEFRFPLDGLDTFDTRSVNTVLNVGIGAGAGIPIVGPNGFLELRYAFDLTGIAADDAGTDQDVKVSLFMIRAGIGI